MEQEKGIPALKKVWPYLALGTIWITLGELGMLPWAAVWFLIVMGLFVPTYYL